MQMYYTGKLKFQKEYLRILKENKGEELTEERIKELTTKITEVYEEIQKDYYGYKSLNSREKMGYITRDIYDTSEKGNPARYIYGVIMAVKYYYDIKEGKINNLEEIVIDSTQNKYEVTKEDVDRVLRYIEELEKYSELNYSWYEYEEVIIYSKGWWKWYCIFSIIYVRDVYERIKVKLWNIIKDEMEGKEVKYEINKVS